MFVEYLQETHRSWQTSYVNSDSECKHSKHMTLTATQQHLNEIDTPETIMIISFEWTAAHSSILWRVMDHQSRHGSSNKNTRKKTLHLLGRLDCQIVWWCFMCDLCVYLQKSLPLSLKSDISTLLARHPAGTHSRHLGASQNSWKHDCIATKDARSSNNAWILYNITKTKTLICFTLPLKLSY